ncbi:hypothetical protein NHX12_020610 [Muraenolepis orangiensis]|uniref:Uncharacterized protein n=1 Tax=Muraenolepis orangiensis TaxID=630683 RepID=A0A9Q0ESB7_9TELE|nr:hypothetical protein NHX12_020610 [Muraenolepis orangiensis]
MFEQGVRRGFPVLTSKYRPSLPPRGDTPISGDGAKDEAGEPTVAAPCQLGVAEQVTCHNSGKSLVIGSGELNSWPGAVDRAEATEVNPLSRIVSDVASLRGRSHTFNVAASKPTARKRPLTAGPQARLPTLGGSGFKERPPTLI